MRSLSEKNNKCINCDNFGEEPMVTPTLVFDLGGSPFVSMHIERLADSVFCIEIFENAGEAESYLLLEGIPVNNLKPLRDFLNYALKDNE